MKSVPPIVLFPSDWPGGGGTDIQCESLVSGLYSQIVWSQGNWIQLTLFITGAGSGIYFPSALDSAGTISPHIWMAWNVFFLVSVSWHANVSTVSQVKIH